MAMAVNVCEERSFPQELGKRTTPNLCLAETGVKDSKNRTVSYDDCFGARQHKNRRGSVAERGGLLKRFGCGSKGSAESRLDLRLNELMQARSDPCRKNECRSIRAAFGLQCQGHLAGQSRFSIDPADVSLLNVAYFPPTLR